MNLHIRTLLLCVAAFAATAALHAETPGAETADYRLDIDDFTELRVSDGVNVDYYASTDSAGWAKFTCTPAMASKLLFTNKNSKLTIQVDDFDNYSMRDIPKITVMSSVLTRVENGADSTVRVLKANPVSNLKARVLGNGTLIINDVHATNVDAGISTGSGHIVINGKTGKAKFSNIGTGTIEAGGLEAKEVKTSTFGTGNIDCLVSERLTVIGAGSGTVFYLGTPSKITNRSMGIKVVPVNKQAE